MYTLSLDETMIARAAALVGQEQRENGREDVTEEVATFLVLFYLQTFVANELLDLRNGEEPKDSGVWRTCLREIRQAAREGGADAVIALITKHGISKEVGD